VEYTVVASDVTVADDDAILSVVVVLTVVSVAEIIDSLICWLHKKERVKKS
jgi:hypothetical protein